MYIYFSFSQRTPACTLGVIIPVIELIPLQDIKEAIVMAFTTEDPEAIILKKNPLRYLEVSTFQPKSGPLKDSLWQVRIELKRWMNGTTNLPNLIILD